MQIIVRDVIATSHKYSCQSHQPKTPHIICQAYVLSGDSFGCDDLLPWIYSFIRPQELDRISAHESRYDFKV